MTQYNHDGMNFSSCRRRVRVDFSGGSISSNAGALLLREVDRKSGLTAQVARAIGDQRQRAKVRHEVVTMVRQRVHAAAAGYEDLNDHDALRHDEVVQTACERDESLASSSTLCRFERRAERQWAVAIHQVLVEQLIASHRRAPRELVIDFDATDDPVHGHQHGRFFHGYYDRYCFLPLYAFCRRRMLDWCERHRVGYIVGLARNAVLERKVEVACEGAERGFQATGRKCRVFTEVRYGAGAWRRPRRVIARIEHGPKGRNPRFIVTNLDGQAKALYERVYCQRGEMENRIKEQQLDLFADRTSSPRWWTNQYRVTLAALAYTLLETIRRTALRGTALARAQCRIIRLRLLKLGAVVTRNTRTVAGRLSSTCPDQALFRLLVHRLTAG